MKCFISYTYMVLNTSSKQFPTIIEITSGGVEMPSGGYQPFMLQYPL